MPLDALDHLRRLTGAPDAVTPLPREQERLKVS